MLAESIEDGFSSRSRAPVLSPTCSQTRTGANFRIRLCGPSCPVGGLPLADRGYVPWVRTSERASKPVKATGQGSPPHSVLPRRGFEDLPRRWVGERTFAWLSQNRRMSKDY